MGVAQMPWQLRASRDALTDFQTILVNNQAGQDLHHDIRAERNLEGTRWVQE